MNELPFPLYHGTSTLFLDGIIQSGLAGANPIADWRVLDFARAIHPLVEKHISQNEGWMAKAQSFGMMVEQKSAHMNFQHGDTYLSPALATAVRYAINNRYGSELLTYALDFLQELIDRKVPGVVDEVSAQYPQVFGLLNTSCAPLLVRAQNIATDDLVDENGRDPEHNLERIKQVLSGDNGLSDMLLQQTNFRIRRNVPVSQLTFWLVNVTRWHIVEPEYSLHLILVPGSETSIS